METVENIILVPLYQYLFPGLEEPTEALNRWLLEQKLNCTEHIDPFFSFSGQFHLTFLSICKVSILDMLSLTFIS